MSPASTSLPAPACLNRDPRALEREGYCVIDQPMPRELIDQARASLDRQLAGIGEERPEWLIEPQVRAPDWRFWLELCRHPRILDAVQAALGAEELQLQTSHLIVKPAGDGKPILWHQDNTYWPWVHGDRVVTVWLALDHVDRENGCMEVIPASHAGRPRLTRLATDGNDLLATRVEVTPEQEAQALPIELAPGCFSIHDSFIIHRSAANTSTRRRAGYAMRYGDAARVRLDLAFNSFPAYYVRGGGEHRAPDLIDLRPGCPLPATPRG